MQAAKRAPLHSVWGKIRGAWTQKRPCIHYDARSFLCLGGEIRTLGLLNPIQARYQAALHPEIFRSSVSSANVYYYSMQKLYCQAFFQLFSRHLPKKVQQLHLAGAVSIFHTSTPPTEQHFRFSIGGAMDSVRVTLFTFPN